MKTKDFKRILNSMGFNVVTGSGVMSVKLEETNLAIISLVDQYEFTTRWSGFHELCDSDKENLYNLLDEYARTPVEEREGPKKYIYKFPFEVYGRDFEREKYLMKDDFKIVLDPSGRDWALEHTKFHFTDKQVKELSEMSSVEKALFELCEKIEVSEE